MHEPLAYAERIAYSSKETLRFTYDMAKKYADKEGVYVEAGVAAGAQIIAMRVGAPNKLIYAFDSFQGIPLPSNRDDQYPGIRQLNEFEKSQLPNPGEQLLETTGITSVSVEEFKVHLINSGCGLEKLGIIEGWFEDTVPKKVMPPICILRLDGDLYNSTFVCLQHLFPKVISGGVVIVDDWHLPGCQAACKEYFELIGFEPDWKFISDIAFFTK